MSAAIVGRTDELASVRDFVASVSAGAAALVLEGEAGVGKSTLWNACIAEAEAQGLRVLRSRPAESETALSFSALGDVFDGVTEDVLTAQPDPQRRALARALALDDDDGPVADERSIGVAVLGGLRALAGTRGLIVAVDDVQWLDAASSAALGYATRRLRAERVGVVMARRGATKSALLDELVRSLPPDRVWHVDVRPFDVGALHHVVNDHLGVALPRPLLGEVHEASGGNPFYALELVRNLQRTGLSVEIAQPLPVPDSLHALVHGRLLALPAESRDFLLGVAALSQPRPALVEAATGVSRNAGLSPALEARIVELDGDRIRFTHPLLAAGVYEAADPLRRADVHARLAELVDDPEGKGRHLAASVDEPDAGVASALENAASRARGRGSPRAAALLLERSHELTPADRQEDATRRAVDAAYMHYEAGDSPRAEAQLRGVIAGLTYGKQRARALTRLARVRAYEALDEAVALFLQAIDEAEGDPEILAVAHEGVATCLWRLYDRLEEAVEHAELAAELALELGDEALAGEALGTCWVAELLLGRESAAATGVRALALQPAAEDRRVLAQPRFGAAADQLGWTGDHEWARDELKALLARASEIGDESSMPFVLAHLSLVECELGDLHSALARALEGQEAAGQSGQRTIFAFNLALESLVEARLGREERARAAALGALELVPETGGRQAELVARWALGQLELALGNFEAVGVWLDTFVAFVRRQGIAEPSAIPFVVDHIEGLAHLGRRSEASELLAWYEENAARLDRASALASSARCRGLLAAQAGALDEACSAYEQALGWHATVKLPLDYARTLLALGVAQRRAKRRREAGETLREALSVFEGMDALLWVDRTRAELRRISGRAATPGELTPAEQRVAALVAEGRTNREVAAALFLSDRTVEGHLSRVFSKLGVRSRTELARVLSTRTERHA